MHEDDISKYLYESNITTIPGSFVWYDDNMCKL